MKRAFWSLPGALLLLALAASPSFAQGPPPGGPPPGAPAMPPEFQELMQLRQELGALQQKALADPEISKQRDAMQKTIEAEMGKDPEAAKALARFKVLEPQIEAAVKANDAAKRQTLITEAQGLGRTLQGAQQKAFEANKGLRDSAEAFEKALEAKMKVLDPKAAEKMARFEAIAKKMQGPKMPAPQSQPAK